MEPFKQSSRYIDKNRSFFSEENHSAKSFPNCFYRLLVSLDAAVYQYFNLYGATTFRTSTKQKMGFTIPYGWTFRLDWCQIFCQIFSNDSRTKGLMAYANWWTRRDFDNPRFCLSLCKRVSCFFSFPLEIREILS